MKDNWSKIKSKIIDNAKEIIESSVSPTYNNFEQGLELFKDVLYYKTGIKKLDGLSDTVLEAIYEIYFTKPGGASPAEILMNNLEAFVKKIIYITNGENCTLDRNKNLMYCLKKANLLKPDALGSYPILNETKLARYDGQPNFLKHVCRAYTSRNQFHNAPKLKAVEVYQIVESGLVVYIYAVLENFPHLQPIIGASITSVARNDEYIKHIVSILTYNPSLKMLESDFGIKIDSVDDFQIKVKAKAKKRKEERDEYLKDASKYKIVPLKFLPEIDGVVNNNKYILLHGIATSGKSTILKKLGRDFIEKLESPYLFYLELGEVFKKNNGKSINEEIIKKYKEITSLDLSFDKLDKKVLLLLDGLDEVPTKDSRDTIVQQIIDLKKYNHIQIVLSSRTNDYITNNALIEEYFEKFELLPITPSEIISIGEKILGHGSQFNNFVKIVKNGNLIKAFPKTPLTSILLAILFKEKDIDSRELPKNITELYRKFIDLFLNRWDKNKGISEQFEIQKKEFVLQTIAVHMHKNRMISIPEKDLEDFIKVLSNKKHIGGPQDPKIHLRNLCDRTCVLVYDELYGAYRFFHLTIQEYLAAQKFDHKDDDLLVKNFYDEWWLNPNIFYAGNKTEYPEIIQRISKFEIYPGDPESKFNYVAHSSQVLMAAHNIDNDIREQMLLSMIKIFDEFSKELIKSIITIPNFINEEDSLDKKLVKIKNQSLLDLILTLRDIYIEFFGSPDFQTELTRIWKQIIFENRRIEMCDTTLYCISYCLAVNNRDAMYLEEFVTSNVIEINSRWYKIVDVDINIKNLQNTRKKVILKIRNIANKNKKYIQKQFNERLVRHYQSLTGMA